MKKFTKLLAVLLVSCFVFTACSGQVANNSPGTAKDGNEATIEKAALKLVKATETAGYQLVSTDELKALIDNKEDMILIDTMPAKSYESGRIPTAINVEIPMNMEELKPEQKDALLNALGTDKDKKIVFYCGFVKCERSHVAALIAKEAGFTNIYRHPGGIIAWKDAGYEVEK